MFGIIVLAALLAGIFIAASMRPDSFRVQRSVKIKASPERIFPLINDFNEWEAWSPWEKADPVIRRSYSGAPVGKGAIYEWSGNKKVGQGRMEIVESSSPSRVVIKIDFLKPFEGHNTVEFTLASQSDFTTVTQAMYGPLSFFSKAMGLFISMDRMIGQKYDEGLSAMKAVAESHAP